MSYAREQFADHPAYERTVRFCDNWDQASFDPDYDTLPLAAFEPLVRELFATPRRSIERVKITGKNTGFNTRIHESTGPLMSVSKVRSPANMLGLNFKNFHATVLVSQVVFLSPILQETSLRAIYWLIRKPGSQMPG